MQLLELAAIAVPIPAAWGIVQHFDLHGFTNGLCYAGALLLTIFFIRIFSRNQGASEES